MKIGNIELKNKIIVGPMAGISNIAFRRVVKEFNPGLIYTEMVSDKAINYENKKTINMLDVIDEEHPITMQVFGASVEEITKAAIYIDKNSKADIIDINMGCPVNKVAKKSCAGASLLKEPKLVYDIVKSVKDNVTKPVTVKIRLGWDFDSINYLEIGKLIEKAGADAICLHARTRSQLYGGKASWEAIKRLKEELSIPVIGNGDVVTMEDAYKMIKETNCDAVMISRGTLGNPWLIYDAVEYLKNQNYQKKVVTAKDRKEVIYKHLDYLVELKGEKLGLLEFRGHLAYYVKGLANATYFKQEIFKINEISKLKEIIDLFLK